MPIYEALTQIAEAKGIHIIVFQTHSKPEESSLKHFKQNYYVQWSEAIHTRIASLQHYEYQGIFILCKKVKTNTSLITNFKGTYLSIRVKIQTPKKEQVFNTGRNSTSEQIVIHAFFIPLTPAFKRSKYNQRGVSEGEWQQYYAQKQKQIEQITQNLRENSEVAMPQIYLGYIGHRGFQEISGLMQRMNIKIHTNTVEDHWSYIEKIQNEAQEQYSRRINIMAGTKNLIETEVDMIEDVRIDENPDHPFQISTNRGVEITINTIVPLKQKLKISRREMELAILSEPYISNTLNSLYPFTNQINLIKDISQGKTANQKQIEKSKFKALIQYHRQMQADIIYNELTQIEDKKQHQALRYLIEMEKINEGIPTSIMAVKYWQQKQNENLIYIEGEQLEEQLLKHYMKKLNEEKTRRGLLLFSQVKNRQLVANYLCNNVQQLLEEPIMNSDPGEMKKSHELQIVKTIFINNFSNQRISSNLQHQAMLNKWINSAELITRVFVWCYIFDFQKLNFFHKDLLYKYIEAIENANLKPDIKLKFLIHKKDIERQIRILDQIKIKVNQRQSNYVEQSKSINEIERLIKSIESDTGIKIKTEIQKINQYEIIRTCNNATTTNAETHGDQDFWMLCKKRAASTYDLNQMNKMNQAMQEIGLKQLTDKANGIDMLPATYVETNYEIKVCICERFQQESARVELLEDENVIQTYQHRGCEHQQPSPSQLKTKFIKLKNEFNIVFNLGNILHQRMILLTLNRWIPKYQYVSKITSLSKNMGSETIEHIRQARPIGLMTLLYKNQEGCIMQMIENNYPNFWKVKHAQAGAQKNRSCIETIAMILDRKEQFVKSQSRKVMAFIDLQAAYDNVNHKMLLQVISQRAQEHIEDQKLKNLILTYFKDQYQNAYINVGENIGQITQGIIQGSRLGPQLFTMYLEEWILKDQVLSQKYNFAHQIVSDYRAKKQKSEIYKKYINQCVMACTLDDIYAEFENIEEITKWINNQNTQENMQQFNIHLNIQKTRVMQISDSKSRINAILKFEGKSVEVVNSYFYKQIPQKFQEQLDGNKHYFNTQRCVKCLEKVPQSEHACQTPISFDLYHTVKFLGYQISSHPLIEKYHLKMKLKRQTAVVAKALRNELFKASWLAQRSKIDAILRYFLTSFVLVGQIKLIEALQFITNEVKRLNHFSKFLTKEMLVEVINNYNFIDHWEVQLHNLLQNHPLSDGLCLIKEIERMKEDAQIYKRRVGEPEDLFLKKICFIKIMPRIDPLLFRNIIPAQVQCVVPKCIIKTKAEIDWAAWLEKQRDVERLSGEINIYTDGSQMTVQGETLNAAAIFSHHESFQKRFEIVQRTKTNISNNINELVAVFVAIWDIIILTQQNTRLDYKIHTDSMVVLSWIKKAETIIIGAVPPIEYIETACRSFLQNQGKENYFKQLMKKVVYSSIRRVADCQVIPFMILIEMARKALKNLGVEINFVHVESH